VGCCGKNPVRKGGSRVEIPARSSHFREKKQLDEKTKEEVGLFIKNTNKQRKGETPTPPTNKRKKKNAIWGKRCKEGSCDKGMTGTTFVRG